MIFFSFGYRVQLYDVNEDWLKRAPELFKQELEELCQKKSSLAAT